MEKWAQQYSTFKFNSTRPHCRRHRTALASDPEPTQLPSSPVSAQVAPEMQAGTYITVQLARATAVTLRPLPAQSRPS
jgi:hypothetical protein